MYLGQQQDHAGSPAKNSTLLFDYVYGRQMLFVPDEDYARLPEHTSVTTTDTTTAACTAASAAVDDNNDDDDVGDEDKDAEESDVSTSILFASQAQYLGHSNQVGFCIRTHQLRAEATAAVTVNEVTF